MIWVGKGVSVVVICIIYTYGLVVVLVEKCFDVVVFLMYYDNCIFFYVGVKEIIGFWDLVFVGEK